MKFRPTYYLRLNFGNMKFHLHNQTSRLAYLQAIASDFNFIHGRPGLSMVVMEVGQRADRQVKEAK